MLEGVPFTYASAPLHITNACLCNPQDKLWNRQHSMQVPSTHTLLGALVVCGLPDLACIPDSPSNTSTRSGTVAQPRLQPTSRSQVIPHARLIDPGWLLVGMVRSKSVFISKDATSCASPNGFSASALSTKTPKHW